MSRWLSYFSHPEVFWLLPLLAAVGLAAAWSWRQKRRALRLLGQSGAVHKLLRTRPGTRRLRGLCVAPGLVLLLIGAAGPKWGWDLPRDTGGGHDVVIVLDASQSMMAEQPSRWERSLRALWNLADHLRKHGGPRVALVVFAAEPQLLFPLTRDYDHFRTVLGDLRAGDLPAEIHPDTKAATSGTRFGAALSLAVASFDEPGEEGKHIPRTILLLSDGDDPEIKDAEWERGVHAASGAHVPIHTIGIGDPSTASLILLKQRIRDPGGDRTRDRIVDGPLKYEGQDVKTKLEEAILRDIAARTGGEYLPAQTGVFPLGKLLPALLAKQAADQADTGRGSVPVLQSRQAWFLWPALLLLSATLLFRDKRVARSTAADAGLPSRNGNGLTLAGTGGLSISSRRQRAQTLSPVLGFLIVVTALCQVGAVAPPDDDWVRQGNEAFAAGDFERALALFEKAEPDTPDPGRVAFNKAAVLYRLKRYREAEVHYLRCLEDRQAPPARRSLAFFGLGSTLLRQADDKNVPLLDQAVDAFSACLTEPGLDPRLATDAQYNLEIARWLRFQAAPPPPPPNDDNLQSPQNPNEDMKPNRNPTEDGGTSTQNGQESTDPMGIPGEDPKESSSPGKKRPGSGALQVLPDTDAPLKLSPEDAARHLEELVERIRQQRRRFMLSQPLEARSFKDW